MVERRGFECQGETNQRRQTITRRTSNVIEMDLRMQSETLDRMRVDINVVHTSKSSRDEGFDVELNFWAFGAVDYGAVENGMERGGGGEGGGGRGGRWFC